MFLIANNGWLFKSRWIFCFTVCFFFGVQCSIQNGCPSGNLARSLHRYTGTAGIEHYSRCKIIKTNPFNKAQYCLIFALKFAGDSNFN